MKCENFAEIANYRGHYVHTFIIHTLSMAERVLFNICFF